MNIAQTSTGRKARCVSQYEPPTRSSMPQLTTHKSKSAAAVALVLLLAGLLLAACGGSSANKSTSTSASSTQSAAKSTSTTTTPTTSTTPGGPAGAGRFAQLRQCMEKNGVTLPKRNPGQRGPRGGFLGGAAGPQLPKGVSRAQYEAALKKCGAGAFRDRPGASSPAFKEALARFAACMREKGVQLPEANTSGKGPIFAGVNTSSPQFKAAESKCAVDLGAAFGGRRRPKGAAPGASGAPPAG
jgi:hypothetical protein